MPTVPTLPSQSYSFNYMGQKLAWRVRLLMMRALLRQVGRMLGGFAGAISIALFFPFARTVMHELNWQGQGQQLHASLCPNKDSKQNGRGP